MIGQYTMGRSLKDRSIVLVTGQRNQLVNLSNEKVNSSGYGKACWENNDAVRSIFLGNVVGSLLPQSSKFNSYEGDSTKHEGAIQCNSLHSHEGGKWDFESSQVFPTIEL